MHFTFIMLLQFVLTSQSKNARKTAGFDLGLGKGSLGQF